MGTLTIEARVCVDNSEWSYLEIFNLITSAKTFFFQIRSHSQALGFKTWTYLLGGRHSIHYTLQYLSWPIHTWALEKLPLNVTSQPTYLHSWLWRCYSWLLHCYDADSRHICLSWEFLPWSLLPFSVPSLHSSFPIVWPKGVIFIYIPGYRYKYRCMSDRITYLLQNHQCT